MRIGDHSRGSVQLIENQQFQAKCSCNWNVRVSFADYESTEDPRQQAKEQAEVLLFAHMRQHSDNADTGIQLGDDSDNL